VFKLVNILSDNMSEKKYFHSMARKFLSIESLLRLMQMNNIYDDRRGITMMVTLLQR
jgi:hypothetical protein